MPRTHKVVVYLDESKQWRWRREAGNGELIADSGESYVDRRDCLLSLVAANAQPYDLEVQGDEVTRTELEATVSPLPTTADAPVYDTMDQEEAITTLCEIAFSWAGEYGFSDPEGASKAWNAARLLRPELEPVRGQTDQREAASHD